jgi:hypothetical protein
MLGWEDSCSLAADLQPGAGLRQLRGRLVGEWGWFAVGDINAGTRVGSDVVRADASRASSF